VALSAQGECLYSGAGDFDLLARALSQALRREAEVPASSGQVTAGEVNYQQSWTLALPAAEEASQRRVDLLQGSRSGSEGRN
jgi:DNA-binding NarL/FixJ family response regulator